MPAASLMLGESGDVLKACFEDTDGNEVETLAIAMGRELVAQTAAQAVSTKKGSIWFRLYEGVDYEYLFYNNNGTDAQLEAIRASAIREALFAVPGIVGYSDPTATITFQRQGRNLIPSIPCIKIDCDNSVSNSFIGTLQVL